MTAIVTTKGEQFIATVSSADTPISEGMLADKIILAKVEGLDEKATPQDEEFPEVTLHTFDVTRAAALNADAVVFSALLDSRFGDFEFNWMGLYNSEYDVLIAVAYEPTQLKIATNGEQVGNVLSKGFALNIKSAAQVLDIQTPLESWQFDFTGRQAAAENIQREAMRQVYGSATYVNDAAAVTAGAAVYEVAAGTAIIDGLLVTISATQTDITIDTPVASYPYYIYAEVSQQITSNGVTNKVEIATSQSVLNNYVDATGNTHALELIATLQDENTIIDNREYITDSLTLARSATKTTPGLVSLSNSTTSDSETEAATPKAVKSAKDAADSAASAASAAQSTANTAVSNAATAQSTANSAASAASTAQSTANGRMIGSNNLNEITNKLSAIGNIGFVTGVQNVNADTTLPINLGGNIAWAMASMKTTNDVAGNASADWSGTTLSLRNSDGANRDIVYIAILS